MAVLGGLFAGGGALGNLALAALGVGIQAAIAYFFPQKIKGPRQENLKAQTSKYGDPIARTYGTSRLSGAVIWLKGDKVDEHKKTERTKALGPIQVSYTYSADFAVAFAWNGPISGITRIWADKKLIFENGADGILRAVTGKKTALGKKSSVSITVYLGRDDQQPDPFIELDRGTAPAWPGMAYIVVRGLPLDKFGIRVPNIEAEVVAAGHEEATSVNPVGTIDAWDVTNELMASHYSDFTIAANGVPGGEVLWTSTIPDTPSFGLAVLLISENGDIFSGAWTINYFYFYDAQTGAMRARFIHSGDSEAWQVADSISIDGVCYVMLGQWPSSFLFSNDGGDWAEAVTFGPGFGAIRTLSLGPEYGYAIRGTPTKSLYKIAWTPTSISSETLTTVNASFSGEPLVAHYDDESDSVIVITTTHVYIVDPLCEIVLRSATLPFTLMDIPAPGLSRRLKSGEDRFMIRNTSGNDIYEYKVSDLSIIRTVDASGTSWESKSASFSLNTDRVVGEWDMYGAGVSDGLFWFMPRLASDTVTLRSIVEAECGYVGLTVDATALTQPIRGYTVRDPTAPRGVIEDLQRTQFFDFSQQGGLLKFVNRGPTPVATIDIDWMGMAEADVTENPRLVSEERADIKDMPARISISYPAADAKYRTGTQSLPNPDGLDDSDNDLTFSTPLVMSDNEAAKAIDILMNETREALTIYKTAISSKYFNLTPADVVTLPLDDALSVTAVIAAMEGDTIIETELRHRSIPYTSDAVGNPTADEEDEIAFDSARLQFVAIDGHLLRAADNDDSFYFGVARRSGTSFSSATIYRSTNGGVEYLPWAEMPAEIVHGVALTALPDVPHPFSWDRGSSLIVAVPSGLTLPASVDDETLLSDPTLNAFAIQSGDEFEYLRAATIVDNADGTWTLSNLLRGLKGTDFATGGHAAGNRNYYLDTETFDRPEDGDVGLERIYVPISTGSAFSRDNAGRFSNAGKGLRPWSPVNIAAARDGSGNITGTFNRRDRLGQDWPESGPEDPPMSEASEAYKVFVYDTGTVVRTIDVTAEAFAYSAAEQTADFGSPQPEGTLDIGVVQVSTAYGNGIERLATI